ncbi:mRNA turnover and ribosome assembly protein, partial [Dimargaris verticillata]
MPRSKRVKLISLTKTEAKGRESKTELISQIQQCLDDYAYVYVFAVNNMRNAYLKEVRHAWKTSRFFFGKNKVMAKAFGKTAEDEYQENSRLLGDELTGDVGVFFTNQPPKEVKQFFDNYSQVDYARSGCIATKTVIIPEGPVTRGVNNDPFPNNMESQLRGLGMPTLLKNGVIVSMRDYQICKEGEVLSSKQAQLL